MCYGNLNRFAAFLFGNITYLRLFKNLKRQAAEDKALQSIGFERMIVDPEAYCRLFSQN